MLDNFDPRNLIDRRTEQELFRNLINFTTPVRMLTICDRGGRGKSSLLKRLEYNCRYEIKPPVPVCLIELDKMEVPSAFQFIEEVVERLKKRTHKIEFPKLEYLNVARMAQNYAPFDKSNYGNRDNITVGVDVNSVEPSTVVTGAYYNVGTDTVNISPRVFSQEQEQSAQQKCIEAFFEDLRTLCATQPMVLLFDAWERCDLNLREWITTELFREHCFNPDPNLRPAKLAIVLAGRPYSKEERFGLHDDEFVNVFANQQEYEAMVLSQKPLSEWELEYVRRFLELNGITDVDDDDINYIRNSLKGGRSLVQILDAFTSLNSATQ